MPYQQVWVKQVCALDTYIYRIIIITIVLLFLIYMIVIITILFTISLWWI